MTRERWSGPSTKTQVSYELDGYRGQLTVKGREYDDGVVLADSRNPAKASCVNAFPYDLDRDGTGNWIGELRPRLQAGMAFWLLVVIAWLTLAGYVAVLAFT